MNKKFGFYLLASGYYWVVRATSDTIDMEVMFRKEEFDKAFDYFEKMVRETYNAK